MTASLKTLNNEVNSRLNAGGLTDLACCQLQNAQSLLANNVVYSVANTASLPNHLDNLGRLVYIEDIKEYRLANDSEWTDDVSSCVAIYQNQIWSWGFGCCGRLGDLNSPSRCSPVREYNSATNWCYVAAGAYSAAAIQKDGTLWGSGPGLHLGIGCVGTYYNFRQEATCSTNWCQVANAGCTNGAVKTDGTLWLWGAGSSSDLMIIGQTCSPVQEICSATDWCYISGTSVPGGTKHFSAIKTSGELWAWGSNSYGQLGDGTSLSRCSPVREFCSATDWCQLSVNYRTSLAIKTSGELWAWGYNSCGVLGDGATTNMCSPVREICSATDWCQASLANGIAFGLKTDGTLWGWGGNPYGVLVVGTNNISHCSPVQEICSATDWCHISGRNYTFSAIKTDGTLWSWGRGQCGLLGNGTTANSCSPVQEITSSTAWSLSSSNDHTMAILNTEKGFLE